MYIVYFTLELWKICYHMKVMDFFPIISFNLLSLKRIKNSNFFIKRKRKTHFENVYINLFHSCSVPLISSRWFKSLTRKSYYPTRDWTFFKKCLKSYCICISKTFIFFLHSFFFYLIEYNAMEVITGIKPVCWRPRIIFKKVGSIKCGFNTIVTV